MTCRATSQTTIMDHFGNISEYNAFWAKFAKNAKEVMQESNKLSPSDRQKADMEAMNIIAARGLWGLWNYLQNVRGARTAYGGKYA